MKMTQGNCETEFAATYSYSMQQQLHAQEAMVVVTIADCLTIGTPQM